MTQSSDDGQEGAPHPPGTGRVGATIFAWVIAAGLAGLVWLHTEDPFLGLPVTHPVTLVLFGVCVAVGWGFTVMIWLSPAEEADPRRLMAANLSAEVRRLADAGQKIEAIKVLREQTGAGLGAAKNAVEAYLRRNNPVGRR